VCTQPHLFAGGAAGSVQAHNVLHRHGEHPVGVGIPQVLLVGKRQLVQIVHALNIVRPDARGVHALTVERYALVNPPDGGD
jgi:hypothetical protein